MPNQNIKVFFLRNKLGHPVAAIASTPTITTNPYREGVIKFAVATRNPIDNFDKARGRKIAVARLSSDHYTGIVEGGVGVKERILSVILNGEAIVKKNANSSDIWGKFPQRVREAASLWLGKKASTLGSVQQRIEIATADGDYITYQPPKHEGGYPTINYAMTETQNVERVRTMRDGLTELLKYIDSIPPR
jgi:hypothetical protein